MYCHFILPVVPNARCLLLAESVMSRGVLAMNDKYDNGIVSFLMLRDFGDYMSHCADQTPDYVENQAFSRSTFRFKHIRFSGSILKSKHNPTLENIIAKI